MAVIPPGIDLSATPAPCHSRRVADTRAVHMPRRMRVGYVARIDPEKAPGVFLKAAKEIAIQLSQKILSITALTH